MQSEMATSIREHLLTTRAVGGLARSIEGILRIRSLCAVRGAGTPYPRQPVSESLLLPRRIAGLGGRSPKQLIKVSDLLPEPISDAVGQREGVAAIEQPVSGVKSKRAIGFELLFAEPLVERRLVREGIVALLVVEYVVVLVTGEGSLDVDENALTI